MRNESGNVRNLRLSGSARSSSRYLYLTGFCVNCPSGSEPSHSMRTDGVTKALSRALGSGFVMPTVGAVVNEKNERFFGADIIPPLSTALMTNVCGSDAVGELRPMIESGWVARKKMISSFFTVEIQHVSPLLHLVVSRTTTDGGSIAYR